MIRILGIKIIDRIKEAGLTQGILSKYAGEITTRLGFHEVTDSVCSREAYIILHLNSDDSKVENLIKELESPGGIIVREIVFPAEESGDKTEQSTGTAEILGILVERDPGVIASVQKILTSFGCNIRTRLGINEIFCGVPAGLIILELKGDQEQRSLLEKHLAGIEKVHVNKMVF